jgi:uncharacterized membrane protein
MTFADTVEAVGKVVDAVGIVLIVGGILVATASAAANRAGSGGERLRRWRRSIGAAILLGLEVLVAADIIRTVAVDPTFQSAGVLAVIVLIRTFLSFSLEVELEGRWPWQRAAGAEPAETKSGAG